MQVPSARSLLNSCCAAHPISRSIEVPLRVAAAPRASFQEDVPGRGVVREESAFDAPTGVDSVSRTLVRPADNI